VKLPDVNLLLYALNASSPQHELARASLREAFESDTVAWAWPVLVGVLRLATRPGIFAAPLSVEQSLSVVRAWLADPASVIIHPTEQHAPILGRLLLGAGQGGNLVSDAHLAALAIEHGAELLTFDRDFAQFAGLRWRVPGQGA
jgi:uncharacterized protein